LKYLLKGTVFACFALLSLSACKDDPNPLLTTNAGKLAAIDAGTTNITEERIQPYSALLSRLGGKCNDTQTGISDTAVMAKNVFKSRKGMEVSALSVMQMIDAAIPEGIKLNCDEVIAAIITLQ
jgi:hypothetical protein